MEILLLMGIPYAAFVGYIIITLLINLSKGEKRCRTGFARVSLFLAEIVFTIIGPVIGFWRFDDYGFEIPFAKQYVISIILLVITSSAAFWLARLSSKTNYPLIRIILSAGMLQGIIVCIITSIHFISFIPLGIIYPWAGFELLSPFVAFFLLLREFYFYNKEVLPMEELLPYHKELGFVPLPYKIFQLPFLPRLAVYGLIAAAGIVAQAALLYAIGQPVDGIIKAYTHSVGFIFSN